VKTIRINTVDDEGTVIDTEDVEDGDVSELEFDELMHLRPGNRCWDPRGHVQEVTDQGDTRLIVVKET